MRLLALLCLCTFVARQARAFPAATAASAESMTWPDRGPYCMVGDLNSGEHIQMPQAVAAAVQRTVPEPPARWSIFSVRDFSGQSQRIWSVAGQRRGQVCLLAAAHRWTNLSQPASARLLNQVLEPLQSADLRNQDKLEQYLAHVVELQQYGSCVVMTREFRRVRLTHARLIDGMDADERAEFLRSPVSERFTREEIDSWLQGREERRDALRALCHDLVLSREPDGQQVSVRGNVIGFNGAVEQ